MCWITLFSEHLNNGNRPLNFSELLKELNSCTDRLRALVYCRRDRTPDTFIILKQLVFLQQQKNVDLLRQYKSIHQSPKVE